MKERNRSTLEERVTSKACSGAVKVSTTGSGRRTRPETGGGAHLPAAGRCCGGH